jgi:hypothetical protein
MASIPSAVPFNINHHVWVRLTDDGRAMLRRQHDASMGRLSDMYPYEPPKEVDGWSQWQLHDLMSTFGPYIGMARPMMFYTNIQIDLCKEPCLASAMMAGAAPDLFMALRRLVNVIDAAGLLNLANGVQLGPTVWYVKASDAREAALKALAAASVDERSQSRDTEEWLGPQDASAVPAEERADAQNTPGS